MIVFAIINLAPGSPIEQKIQQLKFGGAGGGGAANVGSVGGGAGSGGDSAISEEVMVALKNSTDLISQFMRDTLSGLKSNEVDFESFYL